MGNRITLVSGSYRAGSMRSRPWLGFGPPTKQSKPCTSQPEPGAEAPGPSMGTLHQARPTRTSAAVLRLRSISEVAPRAAALEKLTGRSASSTATSPKRNRAAGVGLQPRSQGAHHRLPEQISTDHPEPRRVSTGTSTPRRPSPKTRNEAIRKRTLSHLPYSSTSYPEARSSLERLFLER